MNERPKPKSKWYWRVLRWGLIGLAVLVTLVALVVTEEDWRGKRDWEAYKHAAEARGERLDLASVIPAVVPDDQNFYNAPIIAEALASDPDLGTGIFTKTNRTKGRLYFNIYRGRIAYEINQGGSWEKGTITDLKQWQTAFRNFSATAEAKTNGFPVPAQPQTPAADVLLALSVFDPALAELRQASLRPYARMPLHYEKGFEVVGDLLPWLASEKRCIQFTELRTVAEIQAGQAQLALEDEKLSLRVTDTMHDQPYLISQLVRMAMMSYAIQSAYEGLAQRCWDDAQLAELETMLGTEDYLADYEQVMRGERTFAVAALETQRLTRELKWGSGNGEIVTNSLLLMPSAYFYRNELAFCSLYERYIVGLVDVTNGTVSVANYRAAVQHFDEQTNHYSLYQMQARMTVRAVSKSVMKFAIVQSQINLARTACALERYRIAHGAYPASLDMLEPQFIQKVPHDVINGQPLHYRLRDDGQFVLYSVGWNETDDGGKVAFTKSGNVDREKGDWVWQYPAKSP